MGNVKSKEGREEGKEGVGGGIPRVIIPEMTDESLVAIKGSGRLG